MQGRKKEGKEGKERKERKGRKGKEGKEGKEEGKHRTLKIRNFKHQNGGDFNTKKCSFYKGRGQILTLGLF